MSEETDDQLDLDVSIYPEANISDFVGEDWVSVLDAVRQLSTGLIQRCYFYGQLETGKSHLLEAICSLYRDMGKQAIYLPMQALITQSPQILAEMEQYDFIAFDDIDVIASCEAWQEAIFHLINRTANTSCQIVFTSHVSHAELNFSVKDLVSRIGQSAGYVLPKIQLIDDKIDILRTITERRNLVFNDKIMRHLAQHGPNKTSLMIAVVDELQSLSPDIQHKKLKKTVKDNAERIISKYVALEDEQD